jgi:hypothetical protein
MNPAHYVLMTEFAGKPVINLSVSTGETAIKDFYARAFQEWALGNLEGTAEEIFGLPFFWRTTECHVAVGVVITS